MKTNTPLEAIKIKDDDFLEFVWATQNLGRAEFTICPIWKRGKLVALYIYPRQQKDICYYYYWEGNGKAFYTISSYGGLQDPKVWQMFYCKEHKTQSFHLYVPVESKYLWFSVFSDNITIGFTQEKH